MQVELRQLQQRLGITTIVVTHDQREAMTMADIVVIMDQGRVQQIGSPLDTYRSPANAFVAGFIGSTNLLPARPDGGDGRFLVGERRGVGGAGAGATLSIRPEDVRSPSPSGASVPGTVTFVRDLGASIEFIDCGEPRVFAVTSAARAPGRDRRRSRRLVVGGHCVVLTA
jgi:putative spermidine/putrescine transport system ATP-binding protein